MLAIKTWPNILSLLRIILVPVLVIAFYIPFDKGHLLAVIIFLLAAITDWLDGYLARRLNQSSKLGAFLDPVADKLIVIVALVLLVSQPKVFYITVPALIIIVREIIVSGLREWMAEVGKRAHVAVSFIGKCKTTIQMIAIIVLLYCRANSPAILWMIGYLLLYGAAILTIWSMFMYLKAAWPEFLVETTDDVNSDNS